MTPQPHASGPTRAQGTGVTRRQILLVEDDKDIRSSVQQVLEDEGYAVATAENGRQALEALRSGATPDLIILDLRMPIMDGWEFRAAQKSDSQLANIPVLAISADGSAKAEAIDAHAYLRKPLSTETLLDAVVRIMGDVERQRLLRRLEEAERFAALGRLAASVGHEINNPLTYVSMNIDIATDMVGRFLNSFSAGGQSLEDLADLPAMFRECRVGLDRIRDVVKDVQHLSGRRQVKREAFSLNDLVDESLSMARHQVQYRALISKHYADLPSIVGDRSAIGQVLLNLILNAAQALPEGRASENEISLRTYQGQGDVTVEIADTGAGIPPQALPQIFDPFFTTKPLGEGTGLGLAVSCRIVADHGGRIDVDSELGRGSVFRVILPIAARMPDEPRPRESVTPAPGLRSGRILVVDDVASVRGSIATVLSAEHDVTIVSRAAEAFAHLENDAAFDVILCDLLMPELDGRQVLERLLAAWPHLASRVIFMTAGALTPESREFLDRTSQRVLIKPFSSDELRAAVRAHMEDGLFRRN